MTALADQIALNAHECVVQGVSGCCLTAAALQGIGVAPNLFSEARVAVKLTNPLDVVQALCALDGQVASILLLSHALSADTSYLLAEKANCTHIISDHLTDPPAGLALLTLAAALGEKRLQPSLSTVWFMTTSGTTGIPKIVPHTLQSLARSVYRFGSMSDQGSVPIWGLLYDPTRFAGLQVVLQALIGRGCLVAVDTSQALADQTQGLIDHGCTHLSATPTLWRRLLMVPGHRQMRLRQATLGGEIADQSTLRAVSTAFPDARVSHIYASTEAGVGFSVTDGLAGFPSVYLEKAPGKVRLKINEGILWLRPPVTSVPQKLPDIDVDDEGYIRSGDRVSVEGERILFLGRENGLINIAGVKVYPETVEAVIKTVLGVALVQVSSKRSPVTGALVVAEVQLEEGAEPDITRERIQAACRAALDREAIPATIRFVAGFATNAAGKLVRTGG